jgi:two-component system cell cycle sensor histidine kinase/response regulator CckA
LLRADNSVEKLQVSLALYRKLLSLIKKQKSEKEIVRFVVDALFEQYSDCRVAYSDVAGSGDFFIVYSRQPENMPDITGLKASWSDAPAYLAELQKSRVLAIADIREEISLAPVLQKISQSAGSLARVDCPMGFEDGRIGLLSLSHSQPRNWDPHKLDTMREVAELVHLMLREADAQDRLEKSETMFRQFAENIHSVFWMTDPSKQEMIYISPAYEEIWGRTRESLYSSPFSFIEAIYSEDRERVLAAIKEQTTKPYEEIYRIVQPSGELRWIKDRAFLLRNERGEVYRIVGVAEDITALKETKQQLEQTQAQVVAKAKFAALGEMASGMAHEINNPLAVIHGLTRQLKEICSKQREENLVVRESLDTIEKMCNRIAGLVKGMRTFSRKTENDPLVDVEFGNIVKEAVAMCGARLRDSGVAVEVNAPDLETKVRCRPSELLQVLLNLLNNAYDAIEQQQEKWIQLSVFPMSKTVKIKITDSGAGVAEQVRDKIFQPFFTTKEVGRGTGLGLSISKGIVEAHGGTMTLDPSARNTCFVIELPRG